jgi:DNA-directed RNA polymerase specialized sigma24 family protein
VTIVDTRPTATRVCSDCNQAAGKRGLKRGRCAPCYNRHLNGLKKAGKYTPLTPERRHYDGPVPTEAEAEQILSGLYAQYQRRLTAHIRTLLASGDWQLAEDLTQETFVHLWRYHVARGNTLDERVWGLLTAIARQRITGHFRASRSHEMPADFTDQAFTVAHTPSPAGPDTPQLTVLYVELEAAKDALTVTADAYRAAVNRRNTAKSHIGHARCSEAIQRATERLEQRVQAAAEALEQFAEAGDRVTAARAAWNEAAHEHTTGVAR